MDLILPEFRAVSPRSIVGQTVAQHSQQVIETDVSLRVHIEENLPQVIGDPEWLHRTVDALLDNAIKFSPNGIFERFQRVKHVVGPHLFGGVGLGPRLVKQVVEQHRGTIQVDSVEGQGITFLMSLPAIS